MKQLTLPGMEEEKLFQNVLPLDKKKPNIVDYVHKVKDQYNDNEPKKKLALDYESGDLEKRLNDAGFSYKDDGDGSLIVGRTKKYVDFFLLIVATILISVQFLCF